MLSLVSNTITYKEMVVRQMALAEDPSAAPLRPIHYMGNKTRFLQHIGAAVGRVGEPSSAGLDLFTGTGVVARHLALTRPVVAADIQTYSTVLAEALCAPVVVAQVELQKVIQEASGLVDALPQEVKELIAFEETAVATRDATELAECLEFGSLVAGRPSSSQFAELHGAARSAVGTGPESAMLRYYGGVYFSYRQAAELDAIGSCIRTAPVEWRSTGLASLLGAASDAVSTVGSHFAQPVRPRDRSGALKTGWVKRVAERRAQPLTENFEVWTRRYAELKPVANETRIVRGDFRDILASLDPGEVGVVYADPPYTRDHYSRFYHVLETLALGDDPGVSTTRSGSERVPSRGLYRTERHQSPFSIRSQAAEAFGDLFSECKRLGASLVLSYSPSGQGTLSRPEPRVVTVPQLTALASQHFSDVTVHATDRVAHSKFNRLAVNGEVDYDAEVLILARN